MRVQLILEAIDKATAPIRAVRAAMSGLGEAVGKIPLDRIQAAQATAAQRQAEAQSNLIGTMATAASVAAPIANAVKQFNSYEDALTDVGLKADLTGPKLVALGERIRAQARALNTSSVDILKGMDQLAAGGLDIGAAELAIPGVIKAHIATKAAIDDLSKSTVTLINNMKVLPAETQLALDVMAKAGKEGQFELNDMARYFPRLGAQYAAMGQTGIKAVGDIAAALQVIRGQTGTAESAAVALEDVLNKISLGPAKKKFAELGIDIVKVMNDAQKSGNVIETIVETLKKATGGDASKLKDIFGDKQALSGARALMQEYEKFLAIREKAMGGKGTIDADFLIRMGLGVEKARALNVAMAELWTTLGKALAPQLADKVDKIIAIVNAIEAWVKVNPELAANIALVATAIVALLVVIAALKLALAVLTSGLVGAIGFIARFGSIISMLLAPFRILWAVISGFFSGLIGGITSAVAAFGGWAAVGRAVLLRFAGLFRLLLSPIALVGRALMALVPIVASLGAAFMATPVGWIVAAIAVIAAAAYLIYQNWDKIGPWLSQLWTSIGNTLQSAWSSLVSWLSGLGGRISSAMSSGWSSVKGWFSGIFSGAAAALDSGWASVKNWFASIKWPELPSLSVLIGNVFAPVVTTLENGWTAVKNWFAGLAWPELPNPITAISKVLEPVLDWIIGWGTKLENALSAAFDKVGTFLSNVGSKISGMLDPIITGLSRVSNFIFGPSATDVKATTDQANAAKAAIDALAPAAQTAVATVTSIFAGVSFHSHGVAMMQTLATGIRAGAAAAVAAARETVQQIRDHLPHSPAKVGPLSDLDRVQFGQTLATAINAGAPRALAAAHTIAAGLAAAIPASGAFAVGAEAAPAMTAAQPNFARAMPAAKGDGESSVSGSGPISVNLTLSPNFAGSGSGDFIQQLRGALPNIGYELAEAIRAELDRRDRTKH